MNIAQIRKAIVAAVLTLVVGQLAKHGVTLDTTWTDAIKTVVYAAVTGALTWLVPNTPTPSEED